MIPRGHKVIVLASSTTKSGAKIRKGSVGFVAGVGKTYQYHRQQMYITPAKMVFTRYGYETTERNETKFVTLIHPTNPPMPGLHVQKFLNKLTIRSIDMTDRLKPHFVREGVTVNPAASIVVNSLCKDNILLNNLNDLKAWASSILQSGILHSIVTTNTTSELNVAKTALTAGYPEFEARLKQCIFYRKQSNEFIDSIADNQELKALLIKKLRGFLTLQAREDIRNYTKDLDNRFQEKEKLFHILWYFMSNNIPVPSCAREIHGIKSHRMHIEAWMRFLTLIK